MTGGPAPSSSAAVMRRDGRSFWFASRFLPRQVATNAAHLYAFCRTLDDLADQNPTGDTLHRLRVLAADLPSGMAADPCAGGLLALAQQYALPLDVASHLVSAFVEDGTESLHLQTEAELIRYCFGVAGTVGLLMVPLLEVRGSRAAFFAADLGIAMQLTNIARDLLEDARNSRRYLPGDWLGGLSAQQMVSDPDCRPAVRRAIERVLQLADSYYRSAAQGFRFIPYRSRLANRLAAAVYREIGVALRNSGTIWWGPRTVVSGTRRIAVAVRVLAISSPAGTPPDAAELALLHAPFAGLPGTA